MSTRNVEVCRPVDMPLPNGDGAEPGLCKSDHCTATHPEKRAQRHIWLECGCRETEKSRLVEILDFFHRAAEHFLA